MREEIKENTLSAERGRRHALRHAPRFVVGLRSVCREDLFSGIGLVRTPIVPRQKCCGKSAKRLETPPPSRRRNGLPSAIRSAQGRCFLATVAGAIPAACRPAAAGRQPTGSLGAQEATSPAGRPTRWQCRLPANSAAAGQGKGG